MASDHEGYPSQMAPDCAGLVEFTGSEYIQSLVLTAISRDLPPHMRNPRTQEFKHRWGI